MSDHEFSRLMNLPLAYESADSILKSKVGLEGTYKTIRNRLRKHSAVAVADRTLQVMWQQYETPLDELRSFPWLTLLLAKWTFQDASVPLRGGSPLSAQQLDIMRQQLWDGHGNDERRGQDSNVFLMLRSLMYVQTEFQRGSTWSFFRWPALYARLPENNRARKQFREAIGMEPAAFMDLAFALYAIVLGGKMPMHPDPLAPCRPTYGDAVDQIYSLFARDLPTLRQELQRDRAKRLRVKHELYEFPYLKRFPLIRGPDGRLHCWHKLVFARGVEEAVHLRLSEQFEGAYAENFSKAFETYVTELAQATGKPLLTEAEHKQVFGGSSPAVEAVFEGDGCNILVEAKMSLFADDVVIQDSEHLAHQKTKRVRGAIGQAWQVGKQLREHPELSKRFSQPLDFLFVVTSRELLLGSGDKLQRLLPKGAFTYPDDDPSAESRLPFGNVFIVSIEDFEAVMGCVQSGIVDLPKLVMEAAEANLRADSARLFFADFIKKHLKSCPLPTLIIQAREESEARLKAVFKDA